MNRTQTTQVYQPLAYSAERAIFAGAVLDIMRGFSKCAIDSPDIGKHAELLLILLAVIYGHAQGRPMTSSDLAGFLGMPRATVVRKLREAVAAGYVESLTVGQRRVVLFPKANHPSKVANLATTLNRALDQFGKLSKMDTKALASSANQAAFDMRQTAK